MQSITQQAVTPQFVINGPTRGRRRVPILRRGASGGAAALPGRLDVPAVDRLGHPGGDRPAGGGLRRPFGRYFGLAARRSAVLPPVEGDADLALRLLRREGRVEEERGEGKERRNGHQGGALHSHPLRSAPRSGRSAATAHTMTPAMVAL